MMFLFTTSNKIGAKAIRWALEEPCSHFAIVFDEGENGKGIVFHSTLDGVKFAWFNDFYNHNKIVYALKPNDIDLMKEEKIYQTIVRRHYGRSYDYAAFLSFCYYALRRKFTGSAIPGDTNNGSSNRYLCTELAHEIKNSMPEYIPDALSYELITPFSLYKNMSGSKKLEHIPWISGRLNLA